MTLSFRGRSFPRISAVLFYLFAASPFILSDLLLRYKIYYMPYSKPLQQILPNAYSVFWILLFVLLVTALPRRAGKIVYGVLAGVFGVWFFANYCYFSMFNQYLWIRHIALAGEATGYLSSILAFIGSGTILVTVLYILFTVLALLLWHRPEYSKRFTRWLLLLIPILGLLLTEGVMQLQIRSDKAQGAWEVWEKPALVYDLFQDSNKSLCTAGFYQYTFKSIYTTLFPKDTVSAEEMAEIDAYFDGKTVSDNEMTGILEGKNVIFVLMESMDDWVIDETYTPTISYMMEHGINFTDHYMPTVGTGYTFNAEFAANTGWNCPSTASSASIYTQNSYPFALANLFRDAGYHTASFHFNGKNFYNREVMHKRFGYGAYHSLMSYLSIEKCVVDSEAALSDTVYGKMTENAPFCSFFITYSPHLPYNQLDNKLKAAMEKYPELIDESLDEETRNLKLLAHDTDEFFRILLERLEADGLLEDTVIVAFSDHHAYGLNDKEALKSYSLAAGSEILEKNPFFIYAPGITPVEVTKVTQSVDITPTLVNLFGLPMSPYYIGIDAFSEAEGLAYFPDNSWYNGSIHYQPDEERSFTEEEQAIIDGINQEIYTRKRINDLVMRADYFGQKEFKK